MTGEQLRRIRIALGMTGRAMARHLGYNDAHYYRLEAGAHTITARTAKQVLDLARQRVRESEGQI